VTAASETLNLLEDLRTRYNRREFVHPDPIEFLYRYEDQHDREVAGLVAACLAYGRVAQILKSVEAALARLGPSPARFLERTPPAGLRAAFAGFRHRFTAGDDLARLLCGVRRAIGRHGSLERCFVASAPDVGREDGTVLPALAAFVGEVSRLSGCDLGHLLPSPDRGSACKRLNLFLRWMVRSDEVDPGGWLAVPASALVVPLDTHMHRLALAMGFTSRRQADLATALEVTAAFRRFAPEDPVRYDFALTRLGIRSDADMAAFLRRCAAMEAA